MADVDPSAQSDLAAVEAELTRLSEEITANARKTDSNASVLSFVREFADGKIVEDISYWEDSRASRVGDKFSY